MSFTVYSKGAKMCCFKQFDATASVISKTGFMKKWSFIAFVLLLGTISTNAQNYKSALGVRFSSSDAVVNHAITFKHFFKQNTAVEALFSFVKPYALGVLIEKHHPLTNENFTWFWGAGFYAGFTDKKNFGAQGALGLDFKIPEVPVNLSLDWKPELNLIKETFFEPAAVGVSARFTF